MAKNKGIDIQRLDDNIKLDNGVQIRRKWLTSKETPFELNGFPWFFKDRVFRRLPLNPGYTLPKAEDVLANCTAGGQIRFKTNSAKLAIRVNLFDAADMYHMPATGQCGFDCYLGEPGHQRYYSTTKFDHREKRYEYLMYDFELPKIQNVTLNFPLYQGVEEVFIGVDPEAQIFAPTSLGNDRKVIFYGSSITQGGCASRPGMAFTNILSRHLNCECVNLGFSGNGHGEPEVAKVMSEIVKPACYVLDYEANSAKNGLLQKTLVEFIRILRKVHPKVPILVVSKIKFSKENFLKEDLDIRLKLKEFQFETVKTLRDEGDKNIFFYDGSELLGSNSDECTVDGVHPSDLGFMRMADNLREVLEKIL